MFSIVQSPKLILLFACILCLLLSGCGSAQEPTPTPTKTPRAETNAAQAETIATPTPAATATPPPIAEPTPTVTPDASTMSPFTGLPVADPALLQRRPIFVCVNNDANGRRAHWGLSQADLVYEYIIDGFYLTRITAMYQSRQAERIGPVRSARYPNVWMTASYNGVLACSGGTDAIRYTFKHEVNFPYFDADLDDPDYNYFVTIGTDYQTRLHASTTGVDAWLQATGKGQAWQPTHGFQFDPVPPTGQGSASALSLYYPGDNSVQWTYDPTLGGYTRIQGGAQQIDPATSNPIVANNVIIIIAQHELTNIVEDSLGTKSVDVKLWGFGDLRLFRDGQVYEGTWRAGDGDPPRWIGTGEVELPLHPGQSWIQVTHTLKDLSYR